MPTTASSEQTVVTFTAQVSAIGDTTLVRLPADASRQLPSRGQVAVRATLAGQTVDTVVEPDGRRGHWLRVEDQVRRKAGIQAGDSVEVTLQVLPDWPEPDVPDDLADALKQAPGEIRDTWADITPMARWEWVRWVGATANPSTRERRVEVSISKLASGKRRPCCFDLSSCTDPAVAKSGKLREPDEASYANGPVTLSAAATGAPASTAS